MERAYKTLFAAAAAIFAVAIAGCAFTASEFAGTAWYAFDSGEKVDSALVELRFNNDGTGWSLSGNQNLSGEAGAEGARATLSTMGGRASWSVSVSDSGDGATLSLADGSREGVMPDVFKNGAVFYDSAAEAQAARDERMEEIEAFVENTLFESTLIMKEKVYRYGADPETVDYARLVLDGDGRYESEALDVDAETIEENYLLPIGEGTYEISYDDSIPTSDYADDGIEVKIAFDDGRDLTARVSDLGVSWNGSGSYIASFFAE